MKVEKFSANLFILKKETLQEVDMCVTSNREEQQRYDISNLATYLNKV